MRNTSFNSKETYLAYRSEWKADYNKLSKRIRAFKAEIRQPNRNITWEEARELRRLKDGAIVMIEERKASKVEAQLQYLIAHAEKAAKASLVEV